MNSPRGLPSSLRTVADNLTSAANELARVLHSVASALEPSAHDGDDVTGQPAAAAPTAERATATTRAARRKPGSARRSATPATVTRPQHAGASKPAVRKTATAAMTGTDNAVRSAMGELGPATSAQIAAHVNQAAGRRVVDGRSIRGHARRLGARALTRRGQRLYQL